MLAVVTGYAETAALQKGGFRTRCLKVLSGLLLFSARTKPQRIFADLVKNFQSLSPQPEIIKELDEVRCGAELHPRRRMVVIRREDGNFTFAEQYHYVSRHEGQVIAEGWQTLKPEGIYATAGDGWRRLATPRPKPWAPFHVDTRALKAMLAGRLDGREARRHAGSAMVGSGNSTRRQAANQSG